MAEMIWNRDVLFLHPQKTAGMAVSTGLLATLRRPVFLSAPFGHWPTESLPGVAFVTGARHENLRQARDLLAEFGQRLSDFRAILVPMRNPYDMEVSRYFHLRKPNAFESNDERDLALTLPFNEFEKRSTFRNTKLSDRTLEDRESIADYYELGGDCQENLKFIRFETLAEDYRRELIELGYEPTGLLMENDSPERQQRPFTPFIDSPEVEQAVYEKYCFIFDRGFYDRLSFLPPADPIMPIAARRD